MNSFKKILVFILLILCFNIGFSQEKNDSLPYSIYTSSNLSSNFNKYNLNKTLNLTSFKFVSLDVSNIEDGLFTISYNNLNKTPSKYIYDTYMDIYQNLNLKKSFFKVSDLYIVPRKK
ncbi:hypothetical protein [Lutibacter sp. B1]|uniref:hypothetical protein n=1 Tax=Lutibacter sp. B1 TaxID=2725996 RepID=UPI00145768D7|nr:hypothetical protein [Lutibacter sp. B1]NLP57436.1 hypothetical protein [Lutibacter sp. B1]